MNITTQTKTITTHLLELDDDDLDLLNSNPRAFLAALKERLSANGNSQVPNQKRRGRPKKDRPETRSDSVAGAE